MPTLNDVAQQSKVSLLTAYSALSGSPDIDDSTRRTVQASASALHYRLNVTIRDVAKLANVSIATVSYVLNDSHAVSETTRQRVQAAVVALGYRPNITARNLQSSKTHLIGYAWHVMQPPMVNSVLDRFTYWMAQAVEERGYHTLTFAQSPDDLRKAYDDLIDTGRVDGFIVSHTNRNDPRIKHLIERKIPFASFGRANTRWNFPYVDTDGRRGIYLAVQHLTGLGHQQIAIVGWPEGSLSGDARMLGYFDGLDAAGLTPAPDLIIRTENYSEDGTRAAATLMALPASDRPTAIVCLSDMIAFGVMHYLHDFGYQIGQDVAVTGFDDEPLSPYWRPPLTSLRQPIEQIADRLADLVIGQIEGRIGVHDPVAHEAIAPDLIVRASSDPTQPPELSKLSSSLTA